MSICFATIAENEKDLLEKVLDELKIKYVEEAHDPRNKEEITVIITDQWFEEVEFTFDEEGKLILYE